MANYSEDIASVKETIAEDGAKVYLRPMSGGADIETYGILLNYTSNEITGDGIVNGDSILYTDMKVLIPADIEPELDQETITVEYQFVDNKGKVYSIISMSPERPGGEIVLYTLQVRR